MRFALLAVTAFVSFAHAAFLPALDWSFNPVVSTRGGKFVVDQKGRILLVGDVYMKTGGESDPRIRYGVVRLLWDGSIDPAFRPYEAAPTDYPLGITVDEAGRVLFTFDDFAQVGTVRRLMEDGTLDESFVAPLLKNPGSLIALPDGKILVANANSSPPVTRLFSDGSLDETFSTNPDTRYFDGKLLRQPDGKILVLAIVKDDATVELFRLSENGHLDETFRADITHADPYRATAMALQEDGKIIIAGEAWARLLPSGAVDPSFLKRKLNNSHPFVGSIAVGPKGKILLGGSFSVDLHENLVRLNPDGSVDTPFWLDMDAGGISSLWVDNSNRILFSGYFTRVAGGSSTGIARVRAEPVLTLLRVEKGLELRIPNAPNGLVIQATEDFRYWSPIQTNLEASDSITIPGDLLSKNHFQFLRVFSP
jgi:uncharacterized delta-60 repeat protein